MNVMSNISKIYYAPSKRKSAISILSTFSPAEQQVKKYKKILRIGEVSQHDSLGTNTTGNFLFIHLSLI